MTHPQAPNGGSWPSSGDPRGWAASGEAGGGSRQDWAAQNADDGWGPSTAVYAGSGQTGNHNGNGRQGPVDRATDRPGGPAPRRRHSNTAEPGAWAASGPTSARQQRATRTAERDAQRRARPDLAVTRPPERGVAWWVALLVLVVISAIGGLIDTLGSNSLRGGFNIGIVAASVVAVLIVRRSHMFPIVIAPPIVYSVAAVLQLYVRSSGLHDKKVVFDAAANYLVYGFPAIAAATAAVLILAGVRMIARK